MINEYFCTVLFLQHYGADIIVRPIDYEGVNVVTAPLVLGVNDHRCSVYVLPEC